MGCRMINLEILPESVLVVTLGAKIARINVIFSSN
jgi:hypothetical protein